VIATLGALAFPTIFYLGGLDNRVGYIHEGVTRLNEKLDGVREGITAQGARLGTLEHRVGAAESRLDRLRDPRQQPKGKAESKD
jgi:hypothetical protein